MCSESHNYYGMLNLKKESIIFYLEIQNVCCILIKKKKQNYLTGSGVGTAGGIGYPFINEYCWVRIFCSVVGNQALGGAGDGHPRLAAAPVGVPATTVG